MRLLKSNKLLSIVNSYVVDSPQPSNLSYMWNFGSLLATCLGLQLVTGIILAMHYTPNVDLAFISVEHIMRDVNYGWLIRYLHANGASFFFIFVYLHIARGMYYGSYKSPRILPWSIGVIILVLMMGIIAQYMSYAQLRRFYSTAVIGNAVRVLRSKRIGPHNFDVLSVLIGGLLGDMWGTIVTSKTGLHSVRFALEQSVKNQAYLMSVWEFFKERGYTSTTVPFVSLRANGGIIRFYLYTFTSLMWVFTGFYTLIDGKYVKGVTSWIHLYLTPLAIAHWFMQDGSYTSGQGVSFATNSFTHQDVLRLANLLTTKYGLSTSVTKTGVEDQWRINVWKRSMPAFVRLVGPYMHPTMLYKLGEYSKLA